VQFQKQLTKPARLRHVVGHGAILSLSTQTGDDVLALGHREQWSRMGIERGRERERARVWLIPCWNGQNGLIGLMRDSKIHIYRHTGIGWATPRI
jgi:hypothetical protein